MILYPTETIYGLGVSVFDEVALAELFALKGRAADQTVSWAVRNIADIEQYAELSPLARAIATKRLPGPLTLVLPAKGTVPISALGPGNTIAFRIPDDSVAQQVIADFMAEYGVPLSCTSANVSGMAPEATPEAILQQLIAAGRDTSVITEVVDDGPRTGAASTIVRVIGDTVEVLRQGSVVIDSK